MQSRSPGLLLLDATYKLNDLRMLLYVLMVEDGNGESQVVARGARHDFGTDGSVCAPQRLCCRTMRDGRQRYAGEGRSEREVTAGSHPDLPLSCPAHLPARCDRAEDGCVPGAMTRDPQNPPEIGIRRLGGVLHECVH